MAEIVCLVEAENTLGEGPIWHPDERALYWCDNLRPSIQRYDPTSGQVEEWPMPEEVGSIVFRREGGIVAGMKSGFCTIDLESVTVEQIVDPESHLPGTRFNDGKCDRRGRYWCGTMDAALTDPVAALYRLDADRTCHKMDEGFIVANGMAFSPDDRTMYFADSRAESVYAYDFDVETGEITNRRVFISTEGRAGRVDGATVDTEGNYWCAHIHAGEIAKYDPRGRLQSTIELPVRHPTMCTFGGTDLDVLYVTSARRFLAPAEQADQPLAGALFAIHDVGAQGLPEPFYAG